MNDQEWKAAELKRFHAKSYGYYDTIAEFADTLLDEGWLYEQLTWIENGSYGAGECLALQRAFSWGSESKRRNLNAAVGNVFLSCLYGREFNHWGRLDAETHDRLNRVVARWIKKEKEWAVTL